MTPTQVDIPVQPISAADALPLLQHLKGENPPRDWIGDLGKFLSLSFNALYLSWTYPRVLLAYGSPLSVKSYADAEVYKIGRGPVVAHLDLKVDNRQAKVWNVIGIIKGLEEPDRYVILG